MFAWLMPYKVEAEQGMIFPARDLDELSLPPYGVYKLPPKPVQNKVLPKVQPRKDKPAPKPAIKPVIGQQTYGEGEIQSLIIQYAKQYGIAADAPLCIAKFESGFNPQSRNPKSSASGVFQYISGTWKATDEGKAGLSVFNADANIKAAIKYMASRGNTQPWEVRNKCPRVTRLNH